MGAVSFMQCGYGENYKDVFNDLVNEATYEYGNNDYNGTISTCFISSYKKMADVYSASVEKTARKLAAGNMDDVYKRNCVVLDLGIVHYEIVKVKKIIPKITRKAEYKQKYAVMRWEDNEIFSKMIKHYDTKKEADADAIRRSLKNPNDSYFVVKRMINTNNGDDTVTQFKTEIIKRKTKPKTIPEGCIVKEIHKYLFYGVASE